MPASVLGYLPCPYRCVHLLQSRVLHACTRPRVAPAASMTFESKGCADQVEGSTSAVASASASLRYPREADREIERRGAIDSLFFRFMATKAVALETALLLLYSSPAIQAPVLLLRTAAAAPALIYAFCSPPMGKTHSIPSHTIERKLLAAVLVLLFPTSSRSCLVVSVPRRLDVH